MRAAIRRCFSPKRQDVGLPVHARTARQTPVFSVRRSVSRLHSSAPRWWLFDERYSDVWLRYERWRDFRDIYLLRTRRFDMRRWLLVEIPLLCDDQVPGGIHRLRRMLIVPFKRVQTRDLGGCDEPTRRCMHGSRARWHRPDVQSADRACSSRGPGTGRDRSSLT